MRCLSRPLVVAAFLLALHEAGTSSEVGMDGEHEDFLSRENYQRERPSRSAAGSVVQRLEQQTWGLPHHDSERSRGGSGSVVGSTVPSISDAAVEVGEEEDATKNDEATAVTEEDAQAGTGPVDPSLFQEDPDDGCNTIEHAEYWGDLASVPGIPQGAGNHQPTAAECCKSCKSWGVQRLGDAGARGCNGWVWDPGSKDCWLKHLSNAYNPPNINPAIRFTSGAIYPPQPVYKPGAVSAETNDPPYCLHTMITSNGQPYMNWQTRVFYATWRKVSRTPGSPLRHFTRVLHRKTDDELMEEVPTVRIDPTHPECDNGCDYSVKDRARAIAQWTETSDARRCSHVFMAEADYILVKSPPPSTMLHPGHSYGFLFGYIIPWHKDAMPASTVFHDVNRHGPMENVPQSGNAPQVMHVDDLRKIAPTWADLVELGESNAIVKKVFGWVRDMYAFDFAAVRHGLKVHYPPVPFNKLMVQPPADVRLGKGCLMHYTWGPIISDKDGNRLWSFDKRAMRAATGSSGAFHVLEEHPLPPQWDPERGFKLQAGEVVTEEGLGLMRLMVEAFNGAVRSLSRLPAGMKDMRDVFRARGMQSLR